MRHTARLLLHDSQALSPAVTPNGKYSTSAEQETQHPEMKALMPTPASQQCRTAQVSLAGPIITALPSQTCVISGESYDTQPLLIATNLR